MRRTPTRSRRLHHHGRLDRDNPRRQGTAISVLRVPLSLHLTAARPFPRFRRKRGRVNTDPRIPRSHLVLSRPLWPGARDGYVSSYSVARVAAGVNGGAKFSRKSNGRCEKKAGLLRYRPVIRGNRAHVTEVKPVSDYALEIEDFVVEDRNSANRTSLSLDVLRPDCSSPDLQLAVFDLRCVM